MLCLQYPHIFPCWKNVPCMLCLCETWGQNFLFFGNVFRVFPSQKQHFASCVNVWWISSCFGGSVLCKQNSYCDERLRFFGTRLRHRWWNICALWACWWHRWASLHAFWMCWSTDDLRDALPDDDDEIADIVVKALDELANLHLNPPLLLEMVS